MDDFFQTRSYRTGKREQWFENGCCYFSLKWKWHVLKKLHRISFCKTLERSPAIDGEREWDVRKCIMWKNILVYLHTYMELNILKRYMYIACLRITGCKIDCWELILNHWYFLFISRTQFTGRCCGCYIHGGRKFRPRILHGLNRYLWIFISWF